MNSPFLSSVVIQCRETVRNSQSNCKLDPDERLIGHIYESDGRYRTYYLEEGIDNLARFICSSEQEKLVTDASDYAVLNTIGNFLDLCIPTVPIKELVSLLEKYQKDKEKPKFISK